jgi:prevent-host-death family protein
MATVSVRELRNEGGQVLERVARGETLTVTIDGRPVAELRPLPAPRRSAVELVRRRRALPRVDVRRLRADIDRLLDASL